MKDDVITKLAQLDTEMYEELNKEVQELGGKLDEFSAEDKIISITIEDELRPYIEKIVSEVLVKYEKKRAKILKLDIFDKIREFTDV